MISYKIPALQQSNQSNFFNVVPSERDERDWNAEPIYDDVAYIPKKIDWRAYLPPVKNQGNQGSSLACAAAIIAEWHARKIKKEVFTGSPQFLFNVRRNKEETLMTGRDIMKLLKVFGCCKEEVYPYYTKDVITADIYTAATTNKIEGYARIRTMESLKKSLVVNGPCLICFPVYNHTTKLWKQRKDEEKLGCHAMAIIGYNQIGFIVRNSWGKHWDNNGYCMYPYSDWGCHDEIWTAVSEENIRKLKLRNRPTIVKRIEAWTADSTYSLSTNNIHYDTSTVNQNDNVVINFFQAEEETVQVPIPEPREKMKSKKETLIPAKSTKQVSVKMMALEVEGEKEGVEAAAEAEIGETVEAEAETEEAVEAEEEKEEVVEEEKEEEYAYKEFEGKETVSGKNEMKKSKWSVST